jgi:hypothetical protein
VNNVGLYPRAHADTNGTGVVSQAGGVALAEVALLRAEPAVFGAVASDPTLSRTIDVPGAGATACPALGRQ